MGNLLTPLTKTPVVDWTDTVVGPDVPQSMLNALGSLERYTNVPVADAPTRETAMPTAQRYVGQTTYNVATDTFEYWNGTAWKPVNQKSNLPSTINILSNPYVALTGSQYYDYRATVNITTPCVVTVWGKAMAYSNIAPTQWQGFNLALVWNSTVWNGIGGADMMYPAYTGIGLMDVTTFGRYILDVGQHTIGVRVACGGGSPQLTVSLVNVLLMRTAYTPNAAAGVNAYGDW